MANADRPQGLQFGYTKHGGPPQIMVMKTAGTLPIYKGDIVDMTSGWVQSVTATTDLPVGVAAAYTSSTAAGVGDVYVYNDLVNTVFIAQADGTDIAGTSLCGIRYALTATAGTTASEQSLMEIDSSTDTGGPLHVLDKVNRPDNAWGGWVDMYVEILLDAKSRSTSLISS